MKVQEQARIAAAALVAAAFMVGIPGLAQAQTQALTAAQLKAQAKVRVVVAYKSGADAAARAAIAAAGGRIVVDLSDDDALAIELPARALLALQRNAAVDYVEDDPMRYAFGPLGSRPARRAVVATGGTQVTPYGITMVQADQLSDSLASDRKLCIVDSGIDRDHEDLSGITVDGTNLTTSGFWYTDEASHGTHVSGTIAAINNTIGVVGVLPNKHISIYMAKVFDATGSAPGSVINKGIQACMKAKANVVSMSLGGSTASKTEQRIVDRLAKKGILVIAAAGNAGTSALSYPAGFDSVVSVAAIDSNKVVASFSQFNSDVELAGPGVDVLSTVPVGSQTGSSLTVGASSYVVQPMDGSPRATVSGPLADFGIGDTPVAGSMAGKVCLIARGTIAFSDKVLNCQTSGGIGAVIYNNTTGDLFGTMNGVVTTIPSIGALQADGATMLTQVGQSATVSVFGNSDAYAYYSGTSMATPHVSAVAALVWSYFTHCTAAQMRISLDNSAQDLGDPGRDVYYGFGLVQAKAAYDRINTLGCGV
jgi:subtilisin family serine protease